MFVFIDDSGDVDLPGNRPYYALSAIAFNTEDERDGAESTILQLRQEWSKPLRRNEFKFAILNHDDRIRFFEKVGDLPFKHASCVLWKDGLKGRWRDRCFVYEQVIGEMVNGLLPYFREVDIAQKKPLKIRVVADECDDPEYWRRLKERFYGLRSKDGSGMVKSVVPGRSRSSSLLQMADLVCGANRWDSRDYRRFVAVQCLDRHQLPK